MIDPFLVLCVLRFQGTLFERLVFLALLKLKGRLVKDVLNKVGLEPDTGWPEWLDPSDEFVSDRVVHQVGTNGFIHALEQVANSTVDCPKTSVFVPTTSVGPDLVAWTARNCLISAAISIWESASAHKDRNNLRTVSVVNCYTNVMKTDVDDPPVPRFPKLHQQANSAADLYKSKRGDGMLKQIRLSITLPHAAGHEFQ